MATEINESRNRAVNTTGPLLKSLQRLRADETNLALVQANGNKRIRSTEDLGSEVGNFFDLTVKKGILQSQQQQVRDIISKMNAADAAITIINDHLDVIYSYIQEFQGIIPDPTNQIQVRNMLLPYLESALESIEGILNMNYTGGNVFGSNRDSNTPAVVDLVNTSPLAPDGTPTTKYVNQPTIEQKVNLGGININITLKPEAKPIKDMIAALWKIRDTLRNNPPTLVQADLDLFDEAQNGFVAFRCSIKDKLSTAESADIAVLRALADNIQDFESKFEYTDEELTSKLAGLKHQFEMIMTEISRQLEWPTLAEMMRR